MGVGECRYETPSSRSGASPRQPFSLGRREPELGRREPELGRREPELGRREPELLSPLLGERARVRAKSVLHPSVQQR